ncbi:hypothetical protein MCBG_04571 [Micromonospora sp. M42]|nr:hypothetical protein MCBG_04571 [Micromonospora sp. M42]
MPRQGPVTGRGVFPTDGLPTDATDQPAHGPSYALLTPLPSGTTNTAGGDPIPDHRPPRRGVPRLT